MVTTSVAGGAYWRAYVDGETVFSPCEILPALSPAFLHWSDVAVDHADLEYLAVADDRLVTLKLRVVRLRRPVRLDDERAAEGRWATLQSWLTEPGAIERDDAESLVDVLRDRIEWLLEPGWPFSPAAPKLVRIRIDKVCAGYPEVDPARLDAWVHALFT